MEKWGRKGIMHSTNNKILIGHIRSFIFKVLKMSNLPLISPFFSLPVNVTSFYSTEGSNPSYL